MTVTGKIQKYRMEEISTKEPGRCGYNKDGIGLVFSKECRC
jgi:hypothetical protein